MNTKDFLRLGLPLGKAMRLATDFISKLILGGGDKSRLHERDGVRLPTSQVWLV